MRITQEAMSLFFPGQVVDQFPPAVPGVIVENRTMVMDRVWLPLNPPTPDLTTPKLTRFSFAEDGLTHETTRMMDCWFRGVGLTATKTFWFTSHCPIHWAFLDMQAKAIHEARERGELHEYLTDDKAWPGARAWPQGE